MVWYQADHRLRLAQMQETIAALQKELARVRHAAAPPSVRAVGAVGADPDAGFAPPALLERYGMAQADFVVFSQPITDSWSYSLKFFSLSFT